MKNKTPLTYPFTGKHRGVKQKHHNINFVLSLTYLSSLKGMDIAANDVI